MLAERDGDDGAGQPGDERDDADHKRFRGEHLAAPWAGREGCADQASPVFAGDEQGRKDDQDEHSYECADESVSHALVGVSVGRDVAGASNPEGAAGLVRPDTA